MMKKKIVISLCICIGCACFVVGVLMALLVFTRSIDHIEIQKTIIEERSSTKEFIVQLFIAIGTIGAVFISIGGALIRKINEPKFTAYIKKDRPFYQADDTDDEKKHLYSIRIENKNKTSAEKVSVQLIKVLDLNNKKQVVSTIFPRLFVWTDNENSETIDIPMGIEKYFNFIYVTLQKEILNSNEEKYKYSSLISFCTDGKINNTTFKPNQLKTGAFRVYFRIVGSNFIPQTFYVDIKNNFTEKNFVPESMEKQITPLMGDFISPITTEKIKEKFKFLNYEKDLDFGKIIKCKRTK